jgi:hypothetical protein
MGSAVVVEAVQVWRLLLLLLLLLIVLENAEATLVDRISTDATIRSGIVMVHCLVAPPVRWISMVKKKRGGTFLKAFCFQKKIERKKVDASDGKRK